MSLFSKNPHRDPAVDALEARKDGEPRRKPEATDPWFPNHWFPFLKPFFEKWNLSKVLLKAIHKLFIFFIYGVVGFVVLYRIADWFAEGWHGSLLVYKWETRLGVEVLGMYLALLAFVFSEKASKKAEQTQKELVEHIYSMAVSRNKFEDVFDDHLVDELNRFRSIGSKIRLLLSTPAYGYAVVGPTTFETLVDALSSLHADCELEIIFFSPEDHFHYWANVLMWSDVRKEKLGIEFATQFGMKLRDVLHTLSSRRHGHCQVWVTRATTVRLFAFSPLPSRGTVPDNHPEEHVYVAFTDLFSISQDQYGDRFRARSIRVASQLKGQFIEDDDSSYFERIKVCPYTGNSGQKASLYPIPQNLQQPAESHQHFQDHMENLFIDYILGRTKHKVLDKESFRSEMEVLLSRAANDPLDTQEFLTRTTEQVVRYFEALSKLSLIEGKLSQEQAIKIKTAIEKLPSLPIDLAIKNSLVEFLEKRIRALQIKSGTTTQPPVPIQAVTAVQPPGVGAVASGGMAPAVAVPVPLPSKQQLIDCLWELISSGFEQSAYAKRVVEGACVNDVSANNI